MPATMPNRGLAFVYLTVFLDVVGIAMIIPVMPALILKLGGVGIDAAAVAGGWLMFTYAGMQFLCAPIIGNLSDRFGRRPLLLTSVLAFGIDNLICAMAPALGWLFVGRLLAGMAGGSYATAGAYVADVTPPDRRARNYGFMGIAFGVGFVLGPALGGLAGQLSPRAPFFFAAALSFVNFVFGYFNLVESVGPAARRPFSWRRANPFGAFKALFGRRQLIALMAIIVIAQIAHDANPSVWAFSGKLRFGWTERDIGLTLAATGFAMALVMGGLIGPIVRRVGERRAALIGLVLAATGFVGYAFATSTMMMVAFIPVFAFIGLIEPSLKALASARVPANAQGELQGAITSVKSLTMALSPLVMTRVFGYFSGPTAPVHFPGAPFLLAAILLAAAFGVLASGLE
jgi:DHA1 family tetracycline resistance protein-like MFS transporter